MPLFGNGLKGNVTRDGRLISVQGSPVPSPGTLSATPRLSAAQARATAIRNVDGRVTSSSAKQEQRHHPRHRVRRRRPGLAGGVPHRRRHPARLADADHARGRADVQPTSWTRPPAGSSTGATSCRTTTATCGATGPAPRRAAPGRPSTSPGAAGCRPARPGSPGNNTHVWSDVNDDNRGTGRRGGPARARVRSRSRSRTSTPSTAPPAPPLQVQLGLGHDELLADQPQAERGPGVLLRRQVPRPPAAAPIGFTRAAGNFEAVDGDAVQAQRARRRQHRRRPARTATTSTTPTWPRRPTAPRRRMQMYLFHQPGTRTRTGPVHRRPTAATRRTSSTTSTPTACPTGWSSTPNGVSTLGNIQAGAMGEAWSDWYAMDFLVNEGLQHGHRAPTARSGSASTSARGSDLIRTQPLDCPVGSHLGRAAPARRAPGPGGYTYGDFGQIIGASRGARRRRDLGRDAVGPAQRARQQADRVAGHPGDGAVAGQPVLPGRAQRDPAGRPGRQRRREPERRSGRSSRTAAWATSPARVDGDDTAPVEDFSMPPAAGHADGSLTGTVTDARHRRAGRRRASSPSAATPPASPATTPRSTDADGSYTISGHLRPAPTRRCSRAAPATTRSGADALSIASRREHGRTGRCAATGRPGRRRRRSTDFNGAGLHRFGCGAGRR